MNGLKPTDSFPVIDTSQVWAAECHMIHEGRFISNDGQPAWTQLGKVRVIAQSFGEVLEELLEGSTFTIEPACTYNLETGSYQMLGEQKNVVFRQKDKEDGTKVSPRSFGIVTKDFKILEPKKISALIDPILKEAGYTVVTAGMLRGGSSIFIALHTGDRTIVGEKYSDFLTFDLSWEPGRVCKVYSTSVRTVCANTQAIGISSASINMDVSHTGDIDAKMILASEFIANYDERKTEFSNMMEAYARTQISAQKRKIAIEKAFTIPSMPKDLANSKFNDMDPAQLNTLIEKHGAIGDLVEEYLKKEKSHDNSVARAQSARDLANEALKAFDIEFPHFKGSVYAVYNAITQTADWRPGKGDTAKDVVSGPRLNEKLRGAKYLTSLVKV